MEEGCRLSVCEGPRGGPPVNAPRTQEERPGVWPRRGPGEGGGGGAPHHVQSAWLCTEGSGDLNTSFIRSRDTYRQQSELWDRGADGPLLLFVQLMGEGAVLAHGRPETRRLRVPGDVQLQSLLQVRPSLPTGGRVTVGASTAGQTVIITPQVASSHESLAFPQK